MAIWNNPDVVAIYAAKWNTYWSEAKQPPLDYLSNCLTFPSVPSADWEMPEASCHPLISQRNSLLLSGHRKWPLFNLSGVAKKVRQLEFEALWAAQPVKKFNPKEYNGYVDRTTYWACLYLQQEASVYHQI